MRLINVGLALSLCACAAELDAGLDAEGDQSAQSPSAFQFTPDNLRQACETGLDTCATWELLRNPDRLTGDAVGVCESALSGQLAKPTTIGVPEIKVHHGIKTQKGYHTREACTHLLLDLASGIGTCGPPCNPEVPKSISHRAPATAEVRVRYRSQPLDDIPGEEKERWVSAFEQAFSVQEQASGEVAETELGDRIVGEGHSVFGDVEINWTIVIVGGAVVVVLAVACVLSGVCAALAAGAGVAVLAGVPLSMVAYWIYQEWASANASTT